MTLHLLYLPCYYQFIAMSFHVLFFFEVKEHKKKLKKQTDKQKTCEAWEHLSCKEWVVAMYKNIHT